MINELKELQINDIIENVDIKKLTTYKVGGTAKAIVFPENVDQLIKVLTYIKNNKLKYKIIGNGSNLIFLNIYYDLILINLKNFNNYVIKDNIIEVEAGFSVPKISHLAAINSLTGLEFAAGIPGTIGGAVFMNAGAYKTDIGSIISEVKVLTPDLEVKTLSQKELDFNYRSSFFHNNKDYICLSVKLILSNGQKEEILEIMKDRKKRRIDTQPLEFPSAGSVFRNPENDYAGRLIEELGYKGYNLNGAYVSDKHANFIVNKDNATGEDVKELIMKIKKSVKERYNIDLIVEQEFV